MLALQDQPFWIWPAVFGGIATIIGLLWLLDRLIKHYFPSSRKYYSAGGNALVRIDTMFLPDRKHIIEVREHKDAEDDEKGEPPTAGGAS